MKERVTKIEILSTYAGEKVTIRGFTGGLRRTRDMDGRATQITGLESASMDVTGGQVSYGGSNYTGLKLTDREITIDVHPLRLSNNEIKNKVNSLIGLSTLTPLQIRLYTQFEDGTESILTSEAYITSVESPLLGGDTTVKLTIRCPKPYFERDVEITPEPPTLSRSSGGRETAHDEITRDYGVSGFMTERVSRLTSAPSPFVITVNVPRELKTFVTGVRVMVWGDAMGVDMAQLSSASGLHNSPGAMTVQMSSNRRRIGLWISPTAEASSSQYVLQVDNGWPHVYPGFDSMAMEVRYRKQNGEGATLPDDVDIEVEELLIYPRTFGV